MAQTLLVKCKSLMLAGLAVVVFAGVLLGGVGIQNAYAKQKTDSYYDGPPRYGYYEYSYVGIGGKAGSTTHKPDAGTPNKAKAKKESACGGLEIWICARTADRNSPGSEAAIFTRHKGDPQPENLCLPARLCTK